MQTNVTPSFLNKEARQHEQRKEKRDLTLREVSRQVLAQQISYRLKTMMRETKQTMPKFYLTWQTTFEMPSIPIQTTFVRDTKQRVFRFFLHPHAEIETIFRIFDF